MTLQNLYKVWLDLMPSTDVVININKRCTEYFSFVNLPHDLYAKKEIKYFSFDGIRLEVELYD